MAGGGVGVAVTGQGPPQSVALLMLGSLSDPFPNTDKCEHGPIHSRNFFSLPNSAGQAPVPITEASQARACVVGMRVLLRGPALCAPGSSSFPSPKWGLTQSQRMGGFPPVQSRVQDGLTNHGLHRRKSERLSYLFKVTQLPGHSWLSGC